MGVRGLKTFIEKNDGLLIDQYHLHDTFVVVDASNLVCALYIKGQKHERRDLFGGDMVQFGRYLNNFFDNLQKCNIEPILVFDGAQTYEENKSKTAEKHRRALERFQSVLSISRCGFGDFILPATATNVFRSIIVDRDLRVVQCMFEADLECARLSKEYRCPVISNDSDFFLMGLDHGVLTIDLMQHEQVKRYYGSENSINSGNQQSNSNSFFYIETSLFKQDNFVKYLPHLDTRNLPLLGVLAGNDFVESRVFDKICNRLSVSRFGASRQFKKSSNRQQDKIVKILHFLCGKTLNESVNQLSQNVPRERRQNLKAMIKSSLKVYEVPEGESFKSELKKLYWSGFSHTYRYVFDDDERLLQLKYDATIEKLDRWLKQAMERSVLSYRCLELANNNIVFLISHLDDPSLPSAHSCQIRPMRVMLSLMRSAHDDTSFCSVYDRVGYKYAKQTVRPLEYLDYFGKLNFLFYDVPNMELEIRRAILLATFHCSAQMFDSHIQEYYSWLKPHHAEEFVMVKFLMDYVDFENQQVRLWKNFRQAALLCVLNHYYKDKLDEVFDARVEIEDELSREFMENLTDLIRVRKFYRMPTLSKKRQYNCRLMHQITQLQSAIVSFNNLNAFLGDPMTRIRTETWLNSCIIYNLAEGLHERHIKLPTMPEIVYNIPRSDKKVLLSVRV